MSKFYITTSIAYVNGAPHIGHALEFVQADAIARYRRREGDDVFFLTGTDEHGAKIARAAEAAGITPRALVDKNAEKFRALKDALTLSWDDFIRTADETRHSPNVIALWNKLTAAGDIYKKTYQGLYCVGHEAFITEKDLLAPSGVEGEIGICRDHGAAPEIIEEENYFFRLSKYAEEVKKRIESSELQIIPHGRAKEIVNFINQGMEDISFSRPRKDLSWGIPVPNDDTQTIYVWCDALVNYLYPKDRWPADLHCIGKDILRFHTLYWPAMLMSAQMPLPKALFVHGHITAEGQKMSKSLGNVVDPFALVQKYGADAVRYYLLREIPPTDDGDFSEARFKERYEADLANGLGNFAARVTALALYHAPRLGTGLASRGNIVATDMPEQAVTEAIAKARETVRAKMGEYRLHEAVAAVWDLISFGNQYLNDRKPWDKTVTEQDKAKAIGNGLAVLNAVADLLIPFLPDAAEKIKAGKAGMLFPRI